jgi:hypothetical protein
MTREDAERLDLTSSHLDHDAAVTALVGLMNGDVDPDGFESVEAWVRQCYNRPSHVERVMCACNEVLDTHGVEAIFMDGEWEPAATYCNTGDTYAPTVLYCHREDEYMITSWGDYYEALAASDD